MSRVFRMTGYYTSDPSGPAQTGRCFPPGIHRVPEDLPEVEAKRAIAKGRGRWETATRADAEVDSRPGADGEGAVETGESSRFADAERAVAPEETNGATRTRRAPGKRQNKAKVEG